MIRKFLALGIALAVLLTGCSFFQASSEELDQYRRDFIKLVDQATKEAENGQKVLAEIRYKVEHEGMKKTKAQTTLSNGTDIAKQIKDDALKAPIPQEMEPLRSKLITSLDKRIEAYDQLFLYYDFLDEKYKQTGDSLLKESMSLFKEVQKESQQFRK